MAGGSTSEEMDAVDFDALSLDDDRTPPRPVSIYDLDEDLPTRTQTSDEIAEFQRKARERRDPTHRSFGKTSEPAAPTSGRPIPRESGPVRIERPIAPAAAEAELDLDQVLSDVAATIARLPPAPRVPKFDEQRGPLETIHGEDTRPLPASSVRPRAWRELAWGVVLVVITLAALAVLAFAR